MELAQKLYNQLFPSRCLLCRRTLHTALHNNVELCSSCCNRLPYNRRCCQRCALPLAEEVSGSAWCGRCIKKPPLFDYACSLFRYEDEVIGLIHQLKFAEKISYARTLGEMLLMLLQSRLSTADDRPDGLLPVPLHNSRLRQRGFNQSIEIARVIAGGLHIPIEYDAVSRQRKTVSQTGLNARQRQKNINGAFQMCIEIKAKHVLIIDDVMTTGSTVNELAGLLKKNGVLRVGVLSIARAPLKN